MSTRAHTLPRFPDQRWLVMLAAIIGAGLIVNWPVATGLLILILVYVARPFDFATAFLVVVAGSAFVAMAGGELTSQLSLLTAAILMMLGCYIISNPEQAFRISKTSLTWPLLAYLLLSSANALRGILSGHSWRFVGLELIAALAIGSALLVANAFEPRRDLRLAVVALVLIGFGSAFQGFHIFWIERAHTVTFYSVAVPGIVGLLLFNLALRAKSPFDVLGWTLLSLPLFLHQFITFGRGLWTGCLAGIAISVLIFGGLGHGATARWRRIALLVVILSGVGVLGAFAMEIAFGHANYLQQALSRLTSIGSTEVTYETRSNVTRLWEYSVVARQIQTAPWLGHGLGFTFTLRELFSPLTVDQWEVHQNYLLIWLKQGLVGLVLFLWMLWKAILLGAREARRHKDEWESAWLATMSAATLFLAMFSLSNFPFSEVKETFLLALLWGGGMAMMGKGFVRIRWSTPSQGVGEKAG